MTTATMPPPDVHPDPVDPGAALPPFDPALACPKCESPPRYTWHPWVQSKCLCGRYHPDLVDLLRRRRYDDLSTQHLHARCSNCWSYIGVFATADREETR